MNRLKERYQSQSQALRQEFGYGNPYQVPRLVKVVINAGIGRAVTDSKQLETASEVLARLSGQRPIPTQAKQSIASFKLRAGNQIGAKVTLRGLRMYEFLDRLISVVLPRVRDFRGLSPSALDPQGNYSLGITDASIFPELEGLEAGASIGLQVNIVTTARTPAEGRRLLELLGFPIRKETA